MTFESYQCPKTGTPLKKVEESVLKAINQAIEEKQVFTVNGQLVELAVDELWVCPETKNGYPSRESIISLIPNDAFNLKNLPIDL